MTEKESKDLDKILEFSLKSRNATLSTEYLKEKIFPNEKESYIRKLFFILKDDDNNLLYPKTGASHDCFWANLNAESFMSKGGFEKVYADYQLQKIKDERKEKLENLDIKIKTWQVKTKWFPYAVSTAALAFSIFSYNYSKKDKSDILSMQESIKETLSSVKYLDSLSKQDVRPKIDTLKH